LRCWVYVDGFNLYHGLAKRRTCRAKWLNLLELSRRLRPRDTIERIRFFTALVERRTDDPDQQKRQRLYWRALDTLGCVERIEGRFTRWPRWMPLYQSVLALEAQERLGHDVVGIRPEMVQVLRSDEKGSDVNLATHLVHDANQTDPARTFEVALLLSTDSDLAEAIRLVTQEVSKPVYVCKPEPRNRTVELEGVATAVFGLKSRDLEASQFPATPVDARGPFHKPADW
jgi:hypothetical protein